MSCLPAQNVNFDWVAQAGGVIYNKGNSVTLDASGNVYSTGLFGGTVDFDPGPGVVNLNTINGSGFICKLDKNRNFIWAKQIDGTLIRPKSIKIDASGNVIIVGSYYLAIDLDPGPAVVAGSSSENYFIIKLDAAGNFIVGKTFGKGTDPNNQVSLTIDLSGNAYITGNYYTSDFDPGPGIYTLPSGNNDDMFILKLDQNANFVWAKGIGTASPIYDLSNAIAVDANGSVFITGVFDFSCDFDPGPGVFTINTIGLAPFVLKLNTNGGFVWAKHFEPLSINLKGCGYGIAVDQAGNIFVGGTFDGNFDFDPGPGLYPLASFNNFNDAFLCKLDVSGNLLWAKSIGGSFQDVIDAITLDAGGNVYATGSFYNIVDFDPGAGVNNLTSAGQNDVFILKLNSQGNFEWAKNVGGFGVDQRTSVTVDVATGSVYTLGSFEITADMDPDAGVVNLTALGSDDIFLLKLSRCTNNTFHTINAAVCNSYVLNGQTYTSSGIYTQVIPNSTGCDSTITLNLIINRKLTFVDVIICEGQTYYAGGANQTVSGIYKDTLLTSIGCDSVITTILKVTPKPKPNLGPDGNLCTNTQASITPGIFNSYLWHDNSTQPNYTVNSAGKYWVTVKDGNNCSATDTLNIFSIDTIPKNFLPANQDLCYGNVLRIAVPNYFTYQWSTGSISDFIDVSTFGTYYLTVKDFNSCIGTDSITIQRKNCIYMAIPNAFTPDGNSLNEVFKPSINQVVKDYHMIVFNRYGQIVFETHDYTKGWDGTLKGKKQLSGSYVYRIKYTNIFGVETVENGSVLLIR